MEAAHMRVNSPQVIHESIDGEVIIIDLASGSYFSTKGSGAEIWAVMEESPGLTVNELADATVGRFRDAPPDFVTVVSSFVAQLRAEGLVVDADAGASPTIASGGGNDTKVAFAVPTIEKYTDMQDLVLIDPVHQVDATGWPNALPDGAVAQDANA